MTEYPYEVIQVKPIPMVDITIPLSLAKLLKEELDHAIEMEETNG
jgi:hypothetical protein